MWLILTGEKSVDTSHLTVWPLFFFFFFFTFSLASRACHWFALMGAYHHTLAQQLFSKLAHRANLIRLSLIIRLMRECRLFQMAGLISFWLQTNPSRASGGKQRPASRGLFCFPSERDRCVRTCPNEPNLWVKRSRFITTALTAGKSDCKLDYRTQNPCNWLKRARCRWPWYFVSLQTTIKTGFSWSHTIYLSV